MSRSCLLGLAIVLAGCQSVPHTPATLMATGGTAMGLTLISSSFQPGSSIPSRFTCDGQDQSPDLSWSEVPAGTKSFALIEHDPDAPRGDWTHWVVYNLPADTRALPAGAAKHLPAGAKQGQNDWDKAAYGGPCPPSGRHRYVHTLYALDTVLPDLGTPTRAALERAMQGHVLARATLTGTYQRAR